MKTFSTINPKTPRSIKAHANERGAALLMALLFSLLLLAIAGALIITTALSATNAVDATAESQAYYAAEAGMQATLAVLRGNVAPNPLFDTSLATAAANKISFRKAVTPSISNKSGDTATDARLSRWLTYNALTPAGRIELSSPYTAMSGMAYDTKVTDPDGTAIVTFATSGIFPSSTRNPKTSIDFGSPGNTATIAYTPQSSTTITNSGNSTLGSFQVTSANGYVAIPADTHFTLTINQTAPVAGVLNIDCTITGSITKTGSTITSLLYINFAPIPPQTTPLLTNNFGGVLYTRTATSFLINGSGSTPIPVTVTAPEPSRLKVQVTGYGPRGARKQMQMMVSRYAFDYTASGAVTLRGSDTAGSSVSLNVGSSSQYRYSGNDYSGGAPLPAFVVTNTADYLTATTAVPPTSTQVTGSQQVQQASLANLSTLLQTADGARQALDSLRQYAMNQQTPGCTSPTDPSVCDRYFTSSPPDFGSESNILTTFVDGDAVLPPTGGAGLLVVTGTLDMRGSANFKGLILVLGGGTVLRDGGGNGTTLGSIVVAKFDTTPGATGGFLGPTFNSNGGGTSDVFYDSSWVQKALSSGSPRVLGVSEY
ncbi:MAG: hypothetical protein ABR577_13155 [Pyrinomonadaceae bacterium]